MEEALPELIISGENNGPLTIITNNTNYTYEVTKEGQITQTNVTNNPGDITITGTSLERYVFGNDLKGRNVFEIVEIIPNEDGKSMDYIFIDDETLIPNASDNIIALAMVDNELGTLFYVKDKTDINAQVVYKVKLNIEYDAETEQNTVTTAPEYGLVEVYRQTNNTRVGKTVRYDNKLWTILYDDNINGLQMVSNDILLYNDVGYEFGADDNYITDWNKVLSEADLDNNNELSDFEKNVYSYNSIIRTLNTISVSLVTPDQNVLDVRCVGSNPVDKNAENAKLYTASNLQIWPTEDEKYPAGVANNKLKSLDENYISDFDRMIAVDIIGLKNIDQDEDFYLASRFVEEKYNRYEFCIRKATTIGDNWTDLAFKIYNTHYTTVSNTGCGIKPVVELKSDIVFSGEGTLNNPYTF